MPGQIAVLLYRFLLSCAAPVFAWRLLREPKDARNQRLGRGEHATPLSLWIHAASNGEATSARPLIQSLLERFGSLQITVTCNTVTGRDLVNAWGLPRVNSVLAPLDYRWAQSAFIQSHDPKALIIVENEIWPNRIFELSQRDIPVFVISARMSKGSARNWARLPSLSGAVMQSLMRIWPQDDASGVRFRDLGVPEDQIGPITNLKLSVETSDIAPDQALSELFQRETTILAASTHPGEEEQVLGAFKVALEQNPNLRLILAPRHPNRRAKIEQLLQLSGLTYALRSGGAPPTAQTQVYLADTMGEMAQWYQLAGTCFVGGSLVDKGGHTPVEPAQFGSAIVHGPHLSNFAPLYAALQKDRGSTCVETEAALTAAMLLPPDVTREMAKNAKAALAAQVPATTFDDILETIEAVI